MLKCRMFCPLGRFVRGTFCPWDVLLVGRFIRGTFCHVGCFVHGTLCLFGTLYLCDVLSHGMFCPWDFIYVRGTFCPVVCLSRGPFCLRKFCLCTYRLGPCQANRFI